MDPRIAQRRAQVAEGQTRRRLVRLLVLFTVVAAGAAVLWVLRSPAFSIAEIDIEGAVQSDPAPIVTEAGAVEGVPLIEVDTEAVEAALEADPWIREAAVGRDWPQTLVVAVEERVPVAWVRMRGEWVLAAGDGTVLRRDEPPETAPKVLFPQQTPAALAEDEGALAALEFVDELRADLENGAVVRVLEGEVMATVAGFEIRLGRPVEMKQKARALAAVLDEGLEPGSVITLMAPTRPAVLPPGVETTTTTESEG